jgi:pilus retraction protein PilT
MGELDVREHLVVVSETLSRTALFDGLEAAQIEEVALHGALVEFTGGEYIARQGEPSDAFYIFIEGTSVIHLENAVDESVVDLGQLGPAESVGEMGVLLESSRSASVLATNPGVKAMKFSGKQFTRMLHKLPYFGLVMCRTLARRLKTASQLADVLPYAGSVDNIADDTLRLLPVEFQMRHRVIPLEVEGRSLRVGFVDAPTETTLNLIQRLVSGLVVRPLGISVDVFDKLMRTHATGVVSLLADRREGEALDLESILKKMMAEGASDLHLCADQAPRWRIDGHLVPLKNLGVMEGDGVLKLVAKIMPPNRREQFEATSDTDFAYSLTDSGRFRVNVFRDIHGVGAVFRHIPNHVRSLSQLGLPVVTQQFCNLPTGLILVTGPTGSGKSTTLAAMVDYLNTSRDEHIITLEDPVEFVHRSQRCLINQREVGSHTASFSSALRAALREDPDVVLVGEMRDLETVALALETAQTGHLVLATLHTSTAVDSIERIIGLFPSAQQQQARQTLAAVFKGCISQTLLPLKNGGRVGAYEILVGDYAVSNLIRDTKTTQLRSHMETKRGAGNQLLNLELINLVNSGRVDTASARRRAVDKADFDARMKRA